MHPDEYEISLSRELAICKNTIHRIKKTLELLEKKHNKSTDQFLQEVYSGAKLSDDFQADYETWKNTWESLKKWEDLGRQYQEAYKAWKI